MRGPLAAEMYDAGRAVPSWWEASLAPEPERPPLEGDVETDVAIIGGGFAGLNAACALAARGIDTIVLDAGRVGWGASGRNGGIVGFGGHKLSDRAFTRRFGIEEADRWERMVADAINWVREFCRTEGIGEAVTGNAEMLLAHSPRSARELAAFAGDNGNDAEPVPPSGLDDIARHGGVIVRPGFGIHPLAYVRALAHAAERAGAAVFEHSEVVDWRHEGPRHRLATARGTLLAERVLIATNGFTRDSLLPALEARAIPVISNIAVTRPLTAEERARHPWLGEDPAADTRHMVSYFRLLPDGRLLFGARGDIRGSDAGAIVMRRHLASRIAAQLPGFAEAEIEYFWRGPICATARLTPSVAWLDEARRVAVSLGWHGSGVAVGSLGGRLAAELIATGQDAHVPAAMRGAPPRLPLPGLRPLYVAGAITFYRAVDAIT